MLKINKLHQEQIDIIEKVYVFKLKYLIPIVGMFYYVFFINDTFIQIGISNNKEKRITLSKFIYFGSFIFKFIIFAIIPIIIILCSLNQIANENTAILSYILLIYYGVIFLFLPIIFLISIWLFLKLSFV